MKKAAKKTKMLGLAIPIELEIRLIQRAAKESADKKERVSVSEVVREAIEEYLDTWETATFVPDQKSPKR